jgi:formylglycine-generating enzyme required for sulfatase activity
MVERIGKYRIIDRIGRGGMGMIYRAHDPVLDRQVALKLISSDVEITEELRVRFFREAQACARLSHPNIIVIHDMGEDDGRLFIVMELLEGKELKRLIVEDDVLPLEDKLTIMSQVCDGLHYAHQKGIVHRDIKPGNIMLLSTGQVKILDFGVAQIATTERDLTRTGLIMGTLRYVAPEQVQGRADHRSDIFSVGAVFYEFVSGRPPFKGDDPMQILEQLRAHRPPPLTELDPGVPPELAAIVGRALEKNPADRFPDLAEMQAEIGRVARRLGEERERARARVRARHDQLLQLHASLAERIGPPREAPALPVVDERAPLAVLEALERHVNGRIEALQGEIGRADALAPALERATALARAGHALDALADLERIVAEMPDHAKARDVLAAARVDAETGRQHQRVARLVEEAGAALHNGGYALCIAMLEQAAQGPASADTTRQIASLRETAEAELAAQETLRRAHQLAEGARDQTGRARRAALAWAAPQRAPEIWNDAEAQSSAADDLFGCEAYPEAARAFESATLLYQQAEARVHEVLQAIETAPPVSQVAAISGPAGDDAPRATPNNDTTASGDQPTRGGGDHAHSNEKHDATIVMQDTPHDTVTAVAHSGAAPQLSPAARDAEPTPRWRHDRGVSARGDDRSIRKRSRLGLGLGGLVAIALGVLAWLLGLLPPTRPHAGSLLITSSAAGAEVWLGNKKIGETGPGSPLRISDVAPGTHRLWASKEGFRHWARDLEVKANQAQEVRIDLQPLAAGPGHAPLTSLAIRSTIAGAEVWLDGKKIGETQPGDKLNISDVPPGRHRLRASKSGYQAWQRDFEAKASEAGEVTIDLAPLPVTGPRAVGSLAIGSRIAGAEVWLDNKKLGETRPERKLMASDLPAGTHRLSASKEGYKHWARDVELKADQAREVTIDIEPLAPAKTGRGDDGAQMVLVPAGEFWMGSDAAEVEYAKAECRRMSGRTAEWCKERFERELGRHRVGLDAFFIDRFEVTNALFERFVRATGYRTTAEREGGGWVWQRRDKGWGSTKLAGAHWRAPDGPGSTVQADHPVVEVSWLDADAYCRWAGKRLPTEAEWEKAARGATGQRYPWGDSWTSGLSVNGNDASWSHQAVTGFAGDVSPYKVQGLAGNVLEWVADWFDATYYARSPEKNPRGPESTRLRVWRGGAWFFSPVFLRAASRGNDEPTSRSNNRGFRCAQGS